MKKFMILAAVAMLVGRASAAVRDTISLNAGWQFHLGELSGIEAVKNAKSERVNLPHDFLIGQPWVEPDASERPDNSDAGSNVRSRLSPRGFKEMNVGWYRYVLTPKAEWKGRRVVLDFQGIMLVGDVWLNGKHIGKTDYGYLGFDTDISSILKFDGDNEIIVKANTQQPNNSRWYTGGGLYRDVNIIVTDKKLYFPRHPLFIRTENNKKVKIQAEIACFNKVDNISGTTGSFLVVRPWTQFFNPEDRADMPKSQCNNIVMTNIQMACRNFFDVGTSDKYLLRDFTFKNINVKDEKKAFDKTMIENSIVENVTIL